MMKITEQCTGCGVCRAVCPTEAITMTADACGFLTATVRSDLCINCGKCHRICPQNAADGDGLCLPQSIFAAVNRSADTLERSTSGGVFYELASSVLSEGGMVCGCVLDDNCRAVHIVTDRPEDIRRMQGSKYLQSDISDCYDVIRSCLDEGRKLLVVGTPCQIAGVYRAVGTMRETLYTVDLICHGVTSPRALSLYLSDTQQRVGTPVCELSFRSKTDGGNPFVITMNLADGRQIKQSNLQSWYYYFFLKGSMYRDCCYTCRYAREARGADLTLGDFWGAEKYFPVRPSRGVSAVLVNTAHGQELLNRVHDRIDLFASSLPNVRKENHQLNHPSVKPDNHETLMTFLKTENISALYRVFRRESFRGRLITRLRLLVRGGR